MPKYRDELPSVYDVIQMADAKDRARRRRKSRRASEASYDSDACHSEMSDVASHLDDALEALQRSGDVDSIAQLADALHAASLQPDAFYMADVCAALPNVPARHRRRRSSSSSSSSSTSPDASDEESLRTKKLERRARREPDYYYYAPPPSCQRRHVCPTTILAGDYSPHAYAMRRAIREEHARTCPWASRSRRA